MRIISSSYQGWCSMCLVCCQCLRALSLFLLSDRIRSVRKVVEHLQVGGWLGWRFAFWIESLLMLPFAVFGFMSNRLHLKGAQLSLQCVHYLDPASSMALYRQKIVAIFSRFGIPYLSTTLTLTHSGIQFCNTSICMPVKQF